MVNQFEFHPFLYQKNLLDYCKQNNIIVQAHSPLADVRCSTNESVKNIAKIYKKTPAQIFIRWSMQQEAIPIPKSTHKERILENIDVFDFQLSEDDMVALNNLNENLHVRADPTNFK